MKVDTNRLVNNEDNDVPIIVNDFEATFLVVLVHIGFLYPVT